MKGREAADAFMLESLRLQPDAPDLVGVVSVSVAMAGGISAFGLTREVQGRSPAAVLAAGVAAGLGLWAALALPAFAASAASPLATGWLLASLFTAVLGAIAGILALEKIPDEAGVLAAGAILSVVVLSTDAALAAARPTELMVADPIVLAIAGVTGMAAASAGFLVIRMALPWGTLPAAAGLVTFAGTVVHLGAHHGFGGDSGLVAGVPSALPLLAAALAPVVLLAGGSHLLARLVRDAAAAKAASDAARHAAEAQQAAAAEMLAAVRGCLDVMSTEPLPVTPRSYLDAARTLAARLDASLAAPLPFDGAPGRASGKAPDRGSSASPGSAHVLVLANPSGHRTVVAAMLALNGARVTPVASVCEALSLLDAERADLVLVDIDRAGLDAMMLASRIRATPELSHLVIVGMSSDPAVDRPLALDAGMDEFCPKPLRPEQVSWLMASWGLSDRRETPGGFGPEPARAAA